MGRQGPENEAGGVSVRWETGAVVVTHPGLFQPGHGPHVRRFVSRALSVPEVRTVTVNPAEHSAHIAFESSGVAADPGPRLIAALRGPDHPGDDLRMCDPPGSPDAVWVVGRDQPPTRDEVEAEPPVRFGLANATLGLATLTDLVVPGLAPASALLLVGTNLGTAADAAGQLRRRELGLPVLYTTIMGVTLVSGNFMASAAMAWMFRYWKSRAQADLAEARRGLVESHCPPPPPEASLVRGEVEVRVAASRLKPGDEVVVAPGEFVPADGTVVEGAGAVDERGLAWGGAVRLPAPGDSVHAGGRLLTGRLLVRVEQAGLATRGARLKAALHQATRPRPGRRAPTVGAESRASRAVGPTLAAAGVGLLVGDVVTASAILRPDYATGPGLAESLGGTRLVGEGLRKGVLVRDPDLFRRLAEVDLILLEDHSALRHDGVELAAVQTPWPEADDVIRYAASVARHHGGDRSAALAAACRERRLPLQRFDAEPYAGGVAVRHQRHRFRLLEAGDGRDPVGPLVLEVDGRAAGTFRFRPGRRPTARLDVERLREHAGVAVALLSDRAPDDANSLAERLGADQALGGVDAASRSRLLEGLRNRGVRAAWVGPAGRVRRYAGKVHATVALPDPSCVDPTSSPADAVVLRGDLGVAGELWRLAAAAGRDHATALRWSLAPNLLCVAGAFTFGFTGLTSVAISNLGTLGVYRRASAGLREAVRGAS